jgi:hypothetical protein
VARGATTGAATGVSLTSSVPDPESGIAFTAIGKDCFYCLTPLSDPAVHWMGAAGDIYLHPRCVLDLFVRLARDVHECERPAYYRRLREGHGR